MNEKDYLALTDRELKPYLQELYFSMVRNLKYNFPWFPYIRTVIWEIRQLRRVYHFYDCF